VIKLLNINDNEYNLLSQLAYIDFHGSEDILKKLDKTNYTIGDMVQFYLNNEDALKAQGNRCAMDTEEWRKTFMKISNNPRLCNLKIKGYINENFEKGMDYNNQEKSLKTGLGAFCFETLEKEAIIAYRCSETREGFGGEGWKDNFKTGFTDKTVQQEASLKFLNEMKKKYNYRDFITIGHSKGGNSAQYVAVMSDDVKKCVSFDGPGFSDNFIRNNSIKILKARDKIISYEGKMDFVSSLLFGIAGRIIIIDTEEQRDFLSNHKPNIFLDAQGDFYGETKKDIICMAIKTYTIRVSTLFPDNTGLYLIDAVFDILDGKYALYELGSIYIALSGLPFFATHALVELFLLGGYYLGNEVLQKANDLLRNIKRVLLYMAQVLMDKLKELGQDVFEVRATVFQSVESFFQDLKSRTSEFVSRGKSIDNEPNIYVNIPRLYYYSQRLSYIARRTSDINRRLEILYLKGELERSYYLIRTDLLMKYNYKLQQHIKYLNKTAELLENTERRLLRQATSI